MQRVLFATKADRVDWALGIIIRLSPQSTTELSTLCMRRRLLPLISLLAMVAACNIGGRQVELPLSEIEGFPYPIYEQQKTHREWRDVDIDTVAILGASSENLLYRPLGIHGRADGGSYVVDWGDSIIKRFDAAGNLVLTYGEGQGEGPGELSSPMPLSVDKEGSLVVPDAYLRAVIRFGPAGDLLETTKLQFQPFRLTLTADGRYYFALSGFSEDDDMFGIADAPNRPLATFGRSDLDRLMLGGEITTVRNDLIFSPLHFGFIVRFSDAGEIVYAMETLDQVDLPVVETVDMMGTPVRLFKSGVTAKSMLAHSNGNLYIDSAPLSAERGATVIDVYNPSDGSYRYSFEVPGRWRDLDVEGDYFFALSDTSGIVLRLSF